MSLAAFGRVGADRDVPHFTGGAGPALVQAPIEDHRSTDPVARGDEDEELGGAAGEGAIVAPRHRTAELRGQDGAGRNLMPAREVRSRVHHAALGVEGTG